MFNIDFDDWLANHHQRWWLGFQQCKEEEEEKEKYQLFFHCIYCFVLNSYLEKQKFKIFFFLVSRLQLPKQMIAWHDINRHCCCWWYENPNKTEKISVNLENDLIFLFCISRNDSNKNFSFTIQFNFITNYEVIFFFFEKFQN